MKKKSVFRINQVTFCLVFLFSITLLFPNVSAQQGKVNFSGEWTLNETKSNLGDRGFRGASRSLSVKHSGVNMTKERISTNRNDEEMKNIETILFWVTIFSYITLFCFQLFSFVNRKEKYNKIIIILNYIEKKNWVN